MDGINTKFDYEIKHKRHKQQSSSSSHESEKRRSRRRSSSSSSSSSPDRKKKRAKKLKHQRKRSKSSSSSSSSTDSVSIEKTEKKILKREKLKAKKLKKMLKKEKKKKALQENTDVPIALMDKSKIIAPMTKEQWEKKQSVVKRVFDEETGRHRLIKGDGEVIEEIVSRDRHKAINKQATQGDGNFFQAKLASSKR